MFNNKMELIRNRNFDLLLMTASNSVIVRVNSSLYFSLEYFNFLISSSFWALSYTNKTELV